jgi:hypothetical protein
MELNLVNHEIFALDATEYFVEAEPFQFEVM